MMWHGWKELSLFTGGGGGLYGSRLLGWQTVACVEKDAYCQRVIRARQQDGWFDQCPVYDDVFQFDGAPWAGQIDVLSAGFPCQPFSVAGSRLAGDDPRNGWPATIRIIREVGCPFVWLENVPGLLTGSYGYFGTILSQLHESGYDALWRVVSAASVGAPHKRDRLWIFAYKPGALAHARKERFKKHNTPTISSKVGFACWGIDPATRKRTLKSHVGRVADGVADRSNRVAMLGNGQVPQQMVAAFVTMFNEAIGYMHNGDK